jgi:hypothetical protein
VPHLQSERNVSAPRVARLSTWEELMPTSGCTLKYGEPVAVKSSTSRSNSATEASTRDEAAHGVAAGANVDALCGRDEPDAGRVRF